MKTYALATALVLTACPRPVPAPASGAAPVPAPVPAPAPPSRDGARPLATRSASPVGTVLHFVRDWSPAPPFVDLFKTSRPWLTQCTPTPGTACTAAKAFDTGEESALVLDASGWVRSLPAATDAAHTYRFVTTTMLTGTTHFPSGQYVVTYDGAGTLTYGGVARLLNASPGRDVLSVTAGAGGLTLSVTATDPTGTGNYVRNIHVLQPRLDGTPYPDTSVYSVDFLTEIAPYSALRFKDWMNTDGSTQPGDFAHRPQATDARYSDPNGGGVPLEVMAALVAATGTRAVAGADAWFNMPHKATDDYVTRFAALARTVLPTTTHVYVEYSNEAWNDAFGFGQGAWMQTQAVAAWPSSTASPFTKRVNWYGRRAAQVCDLWRAAWGADAGRLVCVMGGQSSNSWEGKQALDCPLWTGAGAGPCGGAASVHGITTLAIAPYFRIQHTTANDRDLARWTKDADGGVSRLMTEILHGGVLTNGPPGGSLAVSYGEMDANASTAVDRRVALVSYEGGCELTNTTTTAAVTVMFANATRDPRMGTAYGQYLAAWRAHGGFLFHHFEDVSHYDKYGTFGVFEYLGENATAKSIALGNFIAQNPRWW